MLKSAIMAEDEEKNKSDVAKREEQVLEFWKENKIFEKSLKQTEGKREFVFYDGPVTANSKPVLSLLSLDHHRKQILFYPPSALKIFQRFYFLSRIPKPAPHALPHLICFFLHLQP